MLGINLRLGREPFHLAKSNLEQRSWKQNELYQSLEQRPFSGTTMAKRVAQHAVGVPAYKLLVSYALGEFLLKIATTIASMFF